MKLIDFSSLVTRKKSYGGSSGNKLSIIYNDELYMLKLPTHAEKNDNLSYTNSSISEYLGCHIFSLLSMTAQETILGKYTYHNIDRIAVACKDFEQDGYILKDFASIKNQIIDSSSNGYGTEIEDILETIERQSVLDPLMLSQFFWHMFVIDAIIGNWDRHNGNWGFLYNQLTDDIKLAPIFDCGSCLFPQMDDQMAKSALRDKQLFNSRIYDFPTSAIRHHDKRINYYEFIKSHAYKTCDQAIEDIKKNINLSSIHSLIEDLDCISNDKKEFLKKIIEARISILLNA